MPTKAGKLKFEDIRQGRIGWMVTALLYDGRVHAANPVRVTLTGRPYRGLNQYGKQLWSFVFHSVTRYGSITVKRRHCVSTVSVGVGPDIVPHATLGRLFVSEKAAFKYLGDMDAKIVDAITLSAMNGVAALDHQIVLENRKKPVYARLGVRL